jgi:hypothetical protein
VPNWNEVTVQAIAGLIVAGVGGIAAVLLGFFKKRPLIKPTLGLDDHNTTAELPSARPASNLDISDLNRALLQTPLAFKKEARKAFMGLDVSGQGTIGSLKRLRRGKVRVELMPWENGLQICFDVALCLYPKLLIIGNGTTNVFVTGKINRIDSFIELREVTLRFL